MNNRNIIQRAINQDMSDEDMQKVNSNKVLQQSIHLEKNADSIAKELFLPGYRNVIDGKKDELASLIEYESPLNNRILSQTPGKVIILRLMGIVAVVLFLIYMPSLFQSPSSDRAMISQELNRLALNSFENSGLIQTTRSVDLNEANHYLYNSYQNGIIISSDKCLINEQLCALTNAAIYVKEGKPKEAKSILSTITTNDEIKSKLLLAVNYQLKDNSYLNNLQTINDNNYPNYKLFNNLLN